MPAAVSVVAPQAVQTSQPAFQARQQPMVFVQTSAPRQPRLQAGGWFARSFASTSGVILAVLLILFGGGALAVLVVCGGMVAVTNTAVKEIEEVQKKDTEVAIKKAKGALAQHGIHGTISADTRRSVSFVQGCTDDVSGSIKTGGGIKSFTISFHVATFDSTNYWTPRRIVVDGEAIYTKD